MYKQTMKNLPNSNIGRSLTVCAIENVKCKRTENFQRFVSHSACL